MKIVGVIPARFASTRFPGKPLHPIAGKPLIALAAAGLGVALVLGDRQLRWFAGAVASIMAII